MLNMHIIKYFHDSRSSNVEYAVPASLSRMPDTVEKDVKGTFRFVHRAYEDIARSTGGDEPTIKC